MRTPSCGTGARPYLAGMGAPVDTSPVILEQIPQTQDRRFAFTDVFGNDKPVELELGIGKGRFLIQSAEAHPERNWVGVEWASRYYRMVAERAAKRGLHNLRVLRDDAGKVVRDNVGDAAVDVLHVYFPDPWPKARHLKRRLVQAPFAREAARILKDGGSVQLATDHEDYAVQMEEVFNADPDFEQTFRAVGDEAPEGVTNWEVKFRREGRTIHKFEYRRKPRGSA
ncbi:MAG: tRNA (guanosine(46)-N7)-methyltransferase TrmB [Planctomycetes bacterium]|nr:tRNA (guanosine(46)-N7)-methyltransferase TrmB [Planctomycetota bacterium]